jgi:hypothetical protein
LLCVLAPSPSKSALLSTDVSRIGTPFAVTGRPAIVGPGISIFVDLLVEVVELFDALVRSLRRMVSVSPTRRATEFSNNATSWPAW